MTRRWAAILALLALAVAATLWWLLPPRIPAPPRWRAVDAADVRLWFRDEEMTPQARDGGGGELRLRCAQAALWIESPVELASAVFLLRGGSGSVSVRSWERWRPWARTPPTAAPPPDASSRLFLEWQNPRLVHRRDDGRLFYRMEIRQRDAGEAVLTYLGPREAVERPLYDVAWDGCGAPDGVAPGESFLALARYRNRSPYPWPDGGNVRVRLGSRWLDAEGAENAERDLPGPVAPGEAQDAWIRVQGPPAPGRHVLELDLAYEPVAWFSEKGAETCRVEVEVTPSR